MSRGEWIKAHGTEIADLWREGKTTSGQLSIRFGVTRSSIIAWLSRKGYMKGKTTIGLTKSNKTLAAAPYEGADIENLPHDTAVLMPLLHSRTELLNTLSRSCGLTTNSLCGPHKDNATVRKRWRAAYLLRKTGLSYPRIGRLLNKNHTSAMYGVKRFKACIDAAKQMAAE